MAKEDDDILGLFETPLPELPKEGRHVTISKGVGTFLLSAGFIGVVGLIVGAYQIAGVVNMGVAHLLIILAWLVTVFAVWLWLLSRPRKHTMKTVLLTAFTFALVFFGLDILMVRLKASQEHATMQSTPTTQVQSTATPAPSPTTAPEVISKPSKVSETSARPVRHTPRNAEREAGINQTMTNSPGGIQAGRDVTIDGRPKTTPSEEKKKP